MGSLMYVSCVLLMTTAPLTDSYTLKPTTTSVDVCLGEKLHLSCGVRFGPGKDIQSLSEVGWNRGEGSYGRINVTACTPESTCTESTTDDHVVLQYYFNKNASNVASLTLTISNSTLKDSVTFSCFALNKTGVQTSENISAIVHSLPNKASYPNCSIKTCSSENADNACTLSCMAEITQPRVSLEWIVSGTNSTEVRLSNNTEVIGNHVVLLYNTTERYINTITCRLSSDELPCLNLRSCSIEPAICSEECPPKEFTSVPSPVFTRASGDQSPTGLSLVMIIVIAAAGAKIVIVLLLILVCFVRSKGSKMKRTKMEGTTATSTTTALTRRQQNAFEDVDIYTMPDCEQASHHTPVELEHLPGGKAGPPGAPSLAYEVVSEAVDDDDNQVVVKTPSQTAPVYEVLKQDEMDRATDNEGPTSGGSEVVVKTPSQTAPAYEVLEQDEIDTATDNEGPTSGGGEVVVKTPSQTAPAYEVLEPDKAKIPRSYEEATYEECDVHAHQVEKETFATEDHKGKAEEGPNKGARSPRSFIQDSEEGKLIENIWYVPYKETRMTE